MIFSLTSFIISFTLFTRQWKQFTTHPQRIFHGAHGHFLQIVSELAADDTQATTGFLYLIEDQLSPLSKVAKKVLTRRKDATCLTSNATTEQPPFTPISLTGTPHLMLDHRKPLSFQCYLLLIKYYVLQSTSIQCSFTEVKA